MKKTVDEKKLVELVEYKIKDVLLNLIYDIADDPASKAEYVMPKCVSEIYGGIKTAYTKLADLFEKTDRAEFEAEIRGITDNIIKSAVNINRYTSFNDALGQKILRMYKLSDISRIGGEVPLNNGRVAELVREYTAKLEDNLEGSFKKAEIISSLPLRMTRDRFDDYVRRGVRMLIGGLPEGFAQSGISRLKDIFYADCEDEFSADIPLMYEKLKATEESLAELEGEALMEAMGDIDGNLDALGDMYGALGMYYNHAMYLNILSLFVVDSDFIFGDDMVLKDLYFALKEMITTGDESLKEDILERAGDEISDRFDAYRHEEEKILKAVNSLKSEELDALDDNIKMTLNVRNTINNMYLSELDERIMLADENEEDADKAVEGLIEYINTVTENMPNSEKKLMKQNFLGHIPAPMSNDELCEYCSYALDGINDRNVSLMTYSDIFHAIDDDEDEEHEHHHHHHDHEHCGCGHHHGHDCDCGHEH